MLIFEIFNACNIEPAYIAKELNTQIENDQSLKKIFFGFLAISGSTFLIFWIFEIYHLNNYRNLLIETKSLIKNKDIGKAE